MVNYIYHIIIHKKENKDITIEKAADDDAVVVAPEALLPLLLWFSFFWGSVSTVKASALHTGRSNRPSSSVPKASVGLRAIFHPNCFKASLRNLVWCAITCGQSPGLWQETDSFGGVQHSSSKLFASIGHCKSSYSWEHVVTMPCPPQPHDHSSPRTWTAYLLLSEEEQTKVKSDIKHVRQKTSSANQPKTNCNMQRAQEEAEKRHNG